VTDEPTQLAVIGNWVWNSQAPPPISGQVRSDNRAWVGAALLAIDYRTDAGLDMSATIAGFKVGDTLRLEHNTDPSRWARYSVLAVPIRVVDHFQIPVSYDGGSGIVPNSGTRILLTLFPSSGPVGDVVSLTFAEVGPKVWTGRASCKHASATTSTFLSTPSELDYTSMVQTALRQQDLMVGCNCPLVASTVNASLVFGDLPLTLQVGQRWIISQTSVTLTGSNFLFGPLTCQKSGAYTVQGSLQLAASVAQGAAGRLNVVVGGAVALSFPVTDIASKATAIIDGMVNIRKNDSIVFTFDNLSATSQTITAMTFSVGAVWTP